MQPDHHPRAGRNLTGNILTLVRVAKGLGFRQLMQPIHTPKSKRLIPQANAPERDVVMTPPDLAAAVIAHFAPQMRGNLMVADGEMRGPEIDPEARGGKRGHPLVRSLARAPGSMIYRKDGRADRAVGSIIHSLAAGAPLLREGQTGELSLPTVCPYG